MAGPEFLVNIPAIEGLDDFSSARVVLYQSGRLVHAPQSDKQAASPLLTDIAGLTLSQGDILYYDGTDITNLGAGTSGHFLQTQGAGANPVWADASTNVAAQINAATSKATPVDADELGLVDSAASNVLKKLTWANLKATLKATAANFLAKTTGSIFLTPTEVWDAAGEVMLTDAATIAVDMSTFINANVTLGGNRTLGNPTNAKPGQSGYIRVVQDGTGSRTLAYGSNWEFAGGSAPTLSTAAAAEDLLFYQVISSTRIYASLVTGIS